MNKLYLLKRKNYLMKTAALMMAFCLSVLFADAQNRPFREHEVFDVPGGQKVEILKCRGEGPVEECDCIYYTDRRQNGTRMWQNANRLREEKRSAQLDKTLAANQAKEAKAAATKPVAKQPEPKKNTDEPTVSAETNAVLRKIQKQNEEIKNKSTSKSTAKQTTTKQSTETYQGINGVNKLESKSTAKQAQPALTLAEATRIADSTSKARAAKFDAEMAVVNPNDVATTSDSASMVTEKAESTTTPVAANREEPVAEKTDSTRVIVDSLNSTTDLSTNKVNTEDKTSRDTTALREKVEAIVEPAKKPEAAPETKEEKAPETPVKKEEETKEPEVKKETPAEPAKQPETSKEEAPKVKPVEPEYVPQSGVLIEDANSDSLAAYAPKAIDSTKAVNSLKNEVKSEMSTLDTAKPAKPPVRVKSSKGRISNKQVIKQKPSSSVEKIIPEEIKSVAAVDTKNTTNDSVASAQVEVLPEKKIDSSETAKVSTTNEVAPQGAIFLEDKPVLNKPVTDTAAIAKNANDKPINDSLKNDKPVVDTSNFNKQTNENVSLEKQSIDNSTTNRLTAETAINEKEATDKPIIEKSTSDNAANDKASIEPASNNVTIEKPRANKPIKTAEVNVNGLWKKAVILEQESEYLFKVHYEGNQLEDEWVAVTQLRNIDSVKRSNTSAASRSSTAASKDCSFSVPAGNISNAQQFSERVAKRKIYEHLADARPKEAGNKLGITFIYYQADKPFVNEVSVSSTHGLTMKNDAAPAGAMIYPVRSKYKLCEMSKGATTSKVVDGKFSCYRNNTGAWVCTAD